MSRVAALGGGILAMALLIGTTLVGLFMLYAGFKGLGHAFGAGWAWAAVVLAVLTKLTLPIAVGVFYFARDLWGWHWAAALLLAAPGLAFMIPGMLAAIVSAAFSRR